MKFLLGVGELLTGRLLTYDAREMSFRNVPLGKNPHCPVCGDYPTIISLMEKTDGTDVCTPKK
jgi:molybdopterin/thiamine biosynthesis adenylyltransferase